MVCRYDLVSELGIKNCGGCLFAQQELCLVYHQHPFSYHLWLSLVPLIHCNHQWAARLGRNYPKKWSCLEQHTSRVFTPLAMSSINSKTNLQVENLWCHTFHDCFGYPKCSKYAVNFPFGFVRVSKNQGYSLNRASISAWALFESSARISTSPT